MKTIRTFLIITLCNFSLFAQTEKEMVIETVNKNSIQGPIYFLADDLLKGRETGTVENKIAASYLANEFRSYGVLPNPKTGDYYQQVTIEEVSPARRVSLYINGKEITKKVAVKANKMSTERDIVFLNFGLASDYNGKNVSNKFVVIKAGKTASGSLREAYQLKEEKAELALNAGALGVIELLKTDDPSWKNLKRNITSTRTEVAKQKKATTSKKGALGYLWVQDKDGALAADLEKGKHKAKIVLEAETRTPIKTQNVIGIVEGTDPNLKNEYVVYSAHYDHIGIHENKKGDDNIYNGARDNAVGVTTVLAMAENTAKYPMKRSALFILFTGEEKGLLGSKYYVENPVIPLKQTVYCFNSDNGGYNDTSKATIIGLNRTTAEKAIKNSVQAFGLTAIDDPSPEEGLFDRSDNVSFAKKGIPSPTFSMGFTSFDGDVTKYYHQAIDHADSLDYEYLEKFFRAYVLTGRSIGNAPKTPFWTTGDKYEAAGKKRYGIK